MTDQDDWFGHLTLEGPLLEMAYTALCISKDRKVVPRYETLGIIHDILLEEKDGYVFCECVGQPEITGEKLASFRDEVLSLQVRLGEIGDKRIKSARFVSMSVFEDWKAENKQFLNEIREEFAGRSVELEIENPKKIFYELVSRSIIGLRIMDNKVFFVGPGEWAVRYDEAKSRFKFGESSIDFDRFRKTPQSFIPRDYWTSRYRDSFIEYALSSKESVPEWFFWEFPDRFGISWRSLGQMKKAIMNAEIREGKSIIEESENGFITLEQIKKINIFTAIVLRHSDRVLKKHGDEIELEFSDLIENAIRDSSIDFQDHIYYRIYTDTVTFSPNFWSTVKDRVYNGRVTPLEIHRGDDVLLETLNEGTIGFKLNKGRITLSMEDSPDNLVLQNGALKWGIEEERAYPASLKF